MNQNMGEILAAFNENVEPFKETADMSYNTEDSGWCSDQFLFRNNTKLPTTMILASHTEFFRPCVLVSNTLTFDYDNFTVIDVDTLTIKHVEGICNPLDLNVMLWIKKNKLNLINCWLRENTILPLTRKLGESYESYGFENL